MANQYPFSIDISTREGQDELMSLWSMAQLGLGQAAWIMKLAQDEFLALAMERGVPPPSEEAIAKRDAELEEKIRPLVRRSERDQARKLLAETFGAVRECAERVTRIVADARDNGRNNPKALYTAALRDTNTAAAALAVALARFDEGRREESEVAADYEESSLRVLEGLEPALKRPDYYLVGYGDILFDYVNPQTAHDIIWSWSQGYTTTAAARAALQLDEDESLEAIARRRGVPEPTEEAITPEEAAMILGDDPVNGDILFHVRRRIKDARLGSYRRSDVEARKLFEDRQNKLLTEISEELDDGG